jgi:hypothetical protein
VITAPKTAAAQRPEREIPLAKQPVYEGKAHEGYPLLIEHCGGLTPFSHCSLTKPIRAMPIIQPNPHSTLIVGIEELRKEGFTHDINVNTTSNARSSRKFLNPPTLPSPTPTALKA